MSDYTEMLKGNAAGLVLTLLSRKPMYGYELIKELHLKSEGLFDLKEGTLYPILHSLEMNEAVEAYWDEKSSMRPRKYYRLTKRGRALLKEKKEQWVEFHRMINQILGTRRCALRT